MLVAKLIMVTNGCNQHENLLVKVKQVRDGGDVHEIGRGGEGEGQAHLYLGCDTVGHDGGHIWCCRGGLVQPSVCLVACHSYFKLSSLYTWLMWNKMTDFKISYRP